MNKALTFITIFLGTVFSVFVLNIVLYALVPAYHDALSSVMDREEKIPVVEVNRAPIQKEAEAEEPDEPHFTNLTAGKETDATLETLSDEDVALSETVEDTAREIVDKEYHEDCGSGKGYWVITYSDGTVVIE